LAAFLVAAASLGGCAQVDRHGHVFMDVDVNQVQPGMSKDQVRLALGSPDTTSTIDGEAYYYISSTQRTVAFMKPQTIDRQVVAVYFDRGEVVRDVAHYGLKDGRVVNFLSAETPARGKDLTLVQQFFGNLGQRRLFEDRTQRGAGPAGIPGI
jgi:outer membrane protein assembly factor BamE (lipoprotein component of BamABCDE complex)